MLSMKRTSQIILSLFLAMIMGAKRTIAKLSKGIRPLFMKAEFAFLLPCAGPRELRRIQNTMAWFQR